MQQPHRKAVTFCYVPCRLGYGETPYPSDFALCAVFQCSGVRNYSVGVAYRLKRKYKPTAASSLYKLAPFPKVRITSYAIFFRVSAFYRYLRCVMFLNVPPPNFTKTARFLKSSCRICVLVPRIAAFLKNSRAAFCNRYFSLLIVFNAKTVCNRLHFSAFRAARNALIFVRHLCAIEMKMR